MILLVNGHSSSITRHAFVESRTPQEHTDDAFEAATERLLRVAASGEARRGGRSQGLLSPCVRQVGLAEYHGEDVIESC